MPIKPKKPCKHNGCPLLTEDRYCEFHIRLHTGDSASAADHDYSSQWQKARKQFLAKHPLCAECDREPATVVDHIQAYRGDQALFWDERNWQQPLKSSKHTSISFPR